MYSTFGLVVAANLGDLNHREANLRSEPRWPARSLFTHFARRDKSASPARFVSPLAGATHHVDAARVTR